MLFLGTKSWDDEELLKFIKDSAKLQAAYCVEQHQANNSELSSIFLNAYKTEYGDTSEPTGNMAVAFDAYVMAVKAIEEAYNNLLNSDVEELAAQAKSEAEALAIRNAYQKALEEGIPSGMHIKEALSKISDFQGASGVINFGGKNEPTKSVTINHIRSGKDMPVYVVG